MDKPPTLDAEIGSVYSPDAAMFTDFDTGVVWDYSEWTSQDMEQMLAQDGKARGLEQVLTLPIRSAPFSIERGKSTQRITDFVENALMSPANSGGMSTPLWQVVAQMTSATVHRRAYFEKVFTEREGKIAYSKLAFRPASTCRMVRTKNGGFDGFEQDPWRPQDKDTLRIPANRSAVYVHGAHRHPITGVSDLEVAYWCYETKKKIRFLWYSFLEAQSLPKTIVQGDDDTSSRDAARKVATLKSSGVLGLSKRFDINTLESSGKGADQFQAALRWLDQEASGSVLAGFTDLAGAAASGTGSFALSKDQSDFFLQGRQAVTREMQGTINDFIVPDLVRWNFGVKAPAPEFRFGPISEYDANSAIAMLQSFSASPQMRVPDEFFEMLTVRVAGFLELDQKKVEAGIVRARAEAEEKAKQQAKNEEQAAKVAPVAGVAGAVAKAAEMVQGGRSGAGATGNPGTGGSAGPRV